MPTIKIKNLDEFAQKVADIKPDRIKIRDSGYQGDEGPIYGTPIFIQDKETDMEIEGPYDIVIDAYGTGLFNHALVKPLGYAFDKEKGIYPNPHAGTKFYDYVIKN